jgi:double-GTPase-like protein
VGIIIAAWDAVPADQQPSGPISYLRENFPMLSQFVEANGDRFEFQVFGVSIVNGDLKNDAEFRSTYLKGKPQDFGIVVHSLSGNIEQSPDITLPVAWALQMNNPL